MEILISLQEQKGQSLSIVMLHCTEGLTPLPPPYLSYFEYIAVFTTIGSSGLLRATEKVIRFIKDSFIKLPRTLVTT
jgi:hypothetical protein